MLHRIMTTSLALALGCGFTALPCVAQLPDGYSVSDPTPLPELLWESYNGSRVQLRIQRHAPTPRDRRLLLIAESLVPDPAVIEAAQDSVLAETGSFGNQARNFERAIDREGPRWAWTHYEELLPFAVHGLAVQYFSDRVREYAEDASGTESTLTVEYDARIVQLGDGRFEARMSLHYDKRCGILCAFVFRHQRTVLFDEDERVIEVRGDRPTSFLIGE